MADLTASLREWAGRLAQQVDPVVTGPGSEHTVSPDRLKPAVAEVRRILTELEKEDIGG